MREERARLSMGDSVNTSNLRMTSIQARMKQHKQTLLSPLNANAARRTLLLMESRWLLAGTVPVCVCVEWSGVHAQACQRDVCLQAQHCDLNEMLARESMCTHVRALTPQDALLLSPGHRPCACRPLRRGERDRWEGVQAQLCV